MNDKYIEMVRSANNAISYFNQYLKEEYHAPGFDLTRINDNEYFVKVVHQNWDAFQWPQGGSNFCGVYLLFGYNSKDATEYGLYIGKSSLSSVGSRLNKHFSTYRHDKHYKMNNKAGTPFILEYIAALNLDSLKAPFLISALEEYIISDLKQKHHLLNCTGN